MQVYRLSRVPLVADYVRGLSALADRVHDNQRRLFQAHYSAPSRTATATRLAHLAGINGGHPVVNAHYGRLGHAFSDLIDFEPDVRPDGTFRWWAMWSQGWYTSEGFVWEMLPQVAEALELLAWVPADQITLPEHETPSNGFVEGSLCRVTVNAYERNQKARAACIAYYGTRCVVCGFDFGETYGQDAEGFIHVHHLRPLSEVAEEYVVNPIEDMRPVCANCHAVIHLGGGCRSLEEMRHLVGGRLPTNADISSIELRRRASE